MLSKITLHFSSSFYLVLVCCDWHKQHGDILYIKRNVELGNFLLRTFKEHKVCEHCQVIGLETLKYLFPRLFLQGLSDLEVTEETSHTKQTSEMHL